MAEKNIFAYKPFLSLNISDFNLFLSENCNPHEKSHPYFPAIPPVKVEVLSSPPPPFFENLIGGSTPHQQKGVGVGVHAMGGICLLLSVCFYFCFD